MKWSIAAAGNTWSIAAAQATSLAVQLEDAQAKIYAMQQQLLF